jgi:hypothetical protein
MPEVTFLGTNGWFDSATGNTICVRLCDGADLAILECTLPPGMPSETHLNPEACARIAREAGVRGLFPSVVQGADGMSLEV